MALYCHGCNSLMDEVQKLRRSLAYLLVVYEDVSDPRFADMQSINIKDVKPNPTMKSTKPRALTDAEVDQIVLTWQQRKRRRNDQG